MTRLPGLYSLFRPEIVFLFFFQRIHGLPVDQ